jgi:hypothetical protein
MGKLLIGIMLGFFGAAVILILLWFWHRKHKRIQPKPRIYASIEEIRSVGELVVFKIIMKEIVTKAEHWLGEWGTKYFQWLASTKKMALIFEFDIDFRYDLRSPDFVIQDEGGGNYRLRMPKCFYEIYIRDINFYDEQNARFLPWLIPDLLNRAFGPGFDESDKNRLKEEAKQEASRMAERYGSRMLLAVQNSAKQTLETLAKAFGAEEVVIDFSNSELIQTKIDSAA